MTPDRSIDDPGHILPGPVRDPSGRGDMPDPVELLEEAHYRLILRQAETIAIQHCLDILHPREIDRLTATIARSLAAAWLDGRDWALNQGADPREVGP